MAKTEQCAAVPAVRSGEASITFTGSSLPDLYGNVARILVTTSVGLFPLHQQVWLPYCNTLPEFYTPLLGSFKNCDNNETKKKGSSSVTLQNAGQPFTCCARNRRRRRRMTKSCCAGACAALALWAPSVSAAESNSTAAWLAHRSALIGSVFGYGPGVVSNKSVPDDLLSYPQDPTTPEWLQVG
jgi:hypothetical protein